MRLEVFADDAASSFALDRSYVVRLEVLVDDATSSFCMH